MPAESDHTAPAPVPSATPVEQPSRDWTSRILIWLILVVLLVVLGLIGAAFLPRYWAQRVADVSDGSFTAGIASGLAAGFFCAAIPLLLVRGVFHRGRSWGLRLALLLLGILVALPNLITLMIVYGAGNGAHAGQRIMDVDAPGFRGATAVGAVVAVAVVALFWILLASRRRRSRELSRLRGELSAQQARDLAAGSAPGDGEK